MRQGILGRTSEMKGLVEFRLFDADATFWNRSGRGWHDGRRTNLEGTRKKWVAKQFSSCVEDSYCIETPSRAPLNTLSPFELFMRFGCMIFSPENFYMNMIFYSALHFSIASTVIQPHLLYPDFRYVVSQASRELKRSRGFMLLHQLEWL